MKKERIWWLCFTAGLMLAEFVVLSDRSNETSVSPVFHGATDEIDEIDEVVFEPIPEVQEVVVLPPDPIKVEAPQLEPIKAITSPGDPVYSQGYTDGYHKALEQFNCPSSHTSNFK